MKIHPFIFNWNRVTNKTQFLESQLSNFSNLTIINSDEEYTKENWVNLGDEAYFGEQFAKALELFDGDILFHVQGDAEYVYWDKIVEKALNCFEIYNCGIYAPNVNYTYWDSRKVTQSHFKEKLFNVTTTDCTAWFLHKDIVNELLKYKKAISQNKFGWGIPFLASAITQKLYKRILRDHNFTIYHKEGTFYNLKKAGHFRKIMLQSLNDRDLVERIVNLYRYKN